MASAGFRISPARDAAYRILRQIEAGRGFAVDLLHSAAVSKLPDVDRRLLTEMVMGVLRWRGELDFQVERLSSKPLKYFDPEVATVLRLGIYQIRFLAKVPKPAVVNESVELVKRARKRSAAGLVNAVLRKCEPLAFPLSGETRSAAPQPEALEAALRSLPQWLRERWTRQFGPEAAKALAWASVSTPPITLRVSGYERNQIREGLAREGITTHPARYAPSALVVESGSVQSSRLWREGRVVIQDEASQLVGLLVRPASGQRVLDLCAAPGIKTSQLGLALGRGMLVACDRSARRLRSMSKLLLAKTPSGVVVALVHLDATRGLPFGTNFDRILLDVPCSGTGTLARNPEIKERLQPEDLPRLADAQTQMLHHALEMLAPGGRLVYVSCSLESEENEQVVERVLAKEPEVELIRREELRDEFPAFSSLFDSHGYFRTRPDLQLMDGFFAAVMVRKPMRRGKADSRVTPTDPEPGAFHTEYGQLSQRGSIFSMSPARFSTSVFRTSTRNG